MNSVHIRSPKDSLVITDGLKISSLKRIKKNPVSQTLFFNAILSGK